jgi:hypothetical protein
MEIAMTPDDKRPFAPRTVAQARTRRARAVRRHLAMAMRKAWRGMRAVAARLAQAWQYHREFELLMHADDRMLVDIGLTRFDVVSAAQESRGWYGRRDALRAAATSRDEAVSVARARRAGLPHMQGPSTVPALPSVMETSNFR